MITVRQQEKLINRFETLSELELQSVLEDLYEILKKRKLEHLVSGLFADEINDKLMDKLAEETEDLEAQIDNLEDDLKEVKQGIFKALVDLETAQKAVEDDHPGWDIPELDNAIRILEDI